mgnify:FL=1
MIFGFLQRTQFISVFPNFFTENQLFMQILSKSAILTHLRGLALRATAPAREGAHLLKAK